MKTRTSSGGHAWTFRGFADELQTANCKLQTANCKLQTANCKPQTSEIKCPYAALLLSGGVRHSSRHSVAAASARAATGGAAGAGPLRCGGSHPHAAQRHQVLPP